MQYLVEKSGGGDSPGHITALYAANMGFGYTADRWGAASGAALRANLGSIDAVQFSRSSNLYGSLDMVDTMVGLYAEPPPQGFGFSDTAFRIFILMASRRLQSDRFLTVDYRPEVYSPLGLDWIEKNGMTSIILRHCPSLAASVPRDASAFAPFRPIAV